MSAYAIGSYVYVACGDLTNFSPDLDSKVAVIDTATDTVVGSVVMASKNPLGFFERTPAGSIYGGDLVIPTAPTFTLTEGWSSRISTTTPTAPTSTCGPTNASLGGLPNRLAADASANKLYAAVTESFSPSAARLRVVDLQTGNVSARLR